jgi:hypothetical protein
MEGLAKELLINIYHYLARDSSLNSHLVCNNWSKAFLPIYKRNILDIFPQYIIRVFRNIDNFASYNKFQINYDHLDTIDPNQVKDKIMLGIDCFSRLFICQQLFT